MVPWDMTASKLRLSSVYPGCYLCLCGYDVRMTLHGFVHSKAEFAASMPGPGQPAKLILLRSGVGIFVRHGMGSNGGLMCWC